MLIPIFLNMFLCMIWMEWGLNFKVIVKLLSYHNNLMSYDSLTLRGNQWKTKKTAIEVLYNYFEDQHCSLVIAVLKM